MPDFPTEIPDHVDQRPNFPEMDGVYWRFGAYAHLYENGERCAGIYLERWIAMAKTRCGWWLRSDDRLWSKAKPSHKAGDKLILTHARKKWAYPTKREAWFSFIRRLEWRRFHWNHEGDRLNMIEAVVMGQSE